MSKRYSRGRNNYRGSRKGDDGLGCLFLMFEALALVLITLFTSKDPTARKVGWAVVIIIALILLFNQ